jgi:uncharacterized protein (TIGR03000 family)
MWQRNRYTSGLVLATLAALFLVPAVGMAQAPGVLQGPSPAPALNPLPIDSLRIMTYGFSTPYYYYNYSPLPTYMTSINYPYIYGAYTKGETPITYPTAVMQEPYRAKPVLTYGAAVPFPSAAAMATLSATGPAAIELRVPENAEVLLQDRPTTQTGRLRHYDLPPLVNGQVYKYTVRVTWREDDRDITETRRLMVRAGDTVTATFGAGPVEPTQSTLRTLTP